ncbi:unnamed protein product [Phytophthora fragariaefolia]|uniref:Unnamed protein product n=1 Tax=Phytophthora fragariaefolia TaxID=1490495 RepID=A0A9W7CV50_9STRA|nr:unnamed protein product [Phytophthora fragariaefolia]
MTLPPLHAAQQRNQQHLAVHSAAARHASRRRSWGYDIADGELAIQQLHGYFATRSAALRRLRDQVKTELARLGSFSLHHIYCQANAHADRLAIKALGLMRTVSECGDHPDGHVCTRTATDSPTPPPIQPTPHAPTEAIVIADSDDDVDADIDVGEVCAADDTCSIPSARLW